MEHAEGSASAALVQRLDVVGSTGMLAAGIQFVIVFFRIGLKIEFLKVGTAMQRKTFKFVPYGPFEVPLKDSDIPRDLRAFWGEIESQNRGLQDAVGCYILAAKRGSTSTPWYVGKTVRLGFRKEAFQTHKRKHYQDVLKNLENRTVEIYLIPRITSTGKPRTKYSGKGKWEGKIGTLEELLIGSALVMNPDLTNVKSKKQIELAGYMNDSGKERSSAARKLAKLLGTQK
jgi:hypothetical protein